MGHAADYMTPRGFRHVLTHTPVDRDAAVLVFCAEPPERYGLGLIVTVTGLELMQNADQLRDLARARASGAVRAYRQERAA